MPADVEAYFVMMDSVYAELVGAPTSAVLPAARGGWRKQYQRGAVYWQGTRDKPGAPVLDGSVFAAKWRALGAEGGVFGYPILRPEGNGCSPTNRTRCPGVDDWSYQAFYGGHITTSPRLGTHEVHGAIAETWKRYAFIGPISLGLPVTDELPTPHRAGRYNHCEFGSIYFSPATGARFVKGAIRDRWARSGWENSALGFPVGDEQDADVNTDIRLQGRFSDFEGGSIFWQRSTGAQIVKGVIRDRYLAMHRNYSPLGYPISEEYPVPGGVRQDFQGGAITYSWTDKQVKVKIIDDASSLKN